MKAKGLFKFVEKKPAGEDGAEAVDEPVPAINFLPDLRGDCKIFEWAGVSFGEYDVMLLQKSLQAHIVASGASSMRFWGKIRGSKADYYVAEGQVELKEGAEEPVEGQEPRGTGVNKFVYWVSNGALSEWTQLPDLKPVDI